MEPPWRRDSLTAAAFSTDLLLDRNGLTSCDRSLKFPTDAHRNSPPVWLRHEGRVSFEAGGLLTTHQLFEGHPVFMITREDDVDIHALRRQGWTITAIANHVGRDPKTVPDYPHGERDPGVRKRALEPFAPFVD